MRLQPFEADYDWFVRDAKLTYTPKETKTRGTVKLCPTCDKCWQEDWHRCINKIHIYLDFPRYFVVDVKECRFCSEEQVAIYSSAPALGKKGTLEAYREVAKNGNKAVIRRLKELMEKKGKRKLIKGE